MAQKKDGTPLRKSFSSFKKSEVVKKMNIALSDASRNIFSEGDEMTFGEFYHMWIFTYKQPTVKPLTFEKYESAYRLKIKPYQISQIKLKNLKTYHFQNYINQLHEEGKITSKSGKDLLMRIRSAIKFAIDEPIIFNNPAKNITIPLDYKDNQKDEVKVFSRIDQQIIIESLTDEVLDLIILTGFMTGLRLGELLALKWSNLSGDEISVTQQYQYNYYVKEDGTRERKYEMVSLKTKESNRTVPVPLKVKKALYSHRQKQLQEKMKIKNIYEDNDLIFADGIGKPIERKRPGRKLQKICNQLGLKEKNFHSLRHSYAKRLFELDVPVKTVQSLMGHSDINTTMNIYTHVMKEKKMKH